MRNPGVVFVVVTLLLGVLRSSLAEGLPSSGRQARSIWPFVRGAPSSGEAPGVPVSPSGQPNLASLDESLAPALLQIQPDDRRVWKIHKYQGFELRPIDLVPGNPNGDGFAPVAKPEVFPGQTASVQELRPMSTGPELPSYSPPVPFRQEAVINGESAFNQQSLQSGQSGTVSFNQQDAINGGTGSTQQNSQSGYNGPVSFNPEPTITGGSNSNQQNSQSSYTNSAELGQSPPRGPLYMAEPMGIGNATPEPDLSFLDDLGGLADYLPDPQDDEQTSKDYQDTSTGVQGSENSSGSEEAKSEPGFFQSLLHKLTFGALGASAGQVKGALEASAHPEPIEPAPTAGLVGPGDGNGFQPIVPTYHLPETKGSYVAYRLPGSAPPGILGGQVANQEATGYSKDTKSTNVAGNNGDLGYAQLAGFTFADYNPVNPRGYQNGRPIHAFVDGPAKLAQNAPTGEYGYPPAGMEGQSLPAVEYGIVPFKPEAQEAPVVEYGYPPAKQEAQSPPVAEYGYPPAKQEAQGPPVVEYGYPPAKQEAQGPPVVEYGYPPAKQEAQGPPVVEYGYPPAKQEAQGPPVAEYGYPPAKQEVQNPPAVEYGYPPAKQEAQGPPVVEYGYPPAKQEVQNPPTLEYGLASLNPEPQNPTKPQFESPADPLLPQNHQPLDTNPNEPINPSEYSLLNFTPPLPYRNLDFGGFSPVAERRHYDNHRSEDSAEIQDEETEQLPEQAKNSEEHQQTENLTETPETTTRAIFVVTPSADVAQTYSRIRSYGSRDSTR